MGCCSLHTLAFVPDFRGLVTLEKMERSRSEAEERTVSVNLKVSALGGPERRGCSQLHSLEQ